MTTIEQIDLSIRTLDVFKERLREIAESRIALSEKKRDTQLHDTIVRQTQQELQRRLANVDIMIVDLGVWQSELLESGR